MTALLLTRIDIFPKLLDAFRDVDDLYVLERLYAAAYGACCIDPSRERLAAYAQVAFYNIFSHKIPPENLLLRDCARGITELAHYVRVLPREVDIVRCRPPYTSRVPKLSVTDSALKKIASKAGDTEILSSCDSYGDFGRYEIENSVNRFVAVKLSSPPPYSSRERFERFEAEVVGSDPGRIAAFKQLQNAHLSGRLLIFQVFRTKNRKPRKPTKAVLRRHAEQICTAEHSFLALLTSKERNRYVSEAKPWLSQAPETKKSEAMGLDVAAAKRWVARKAYDYGWTKKLFQHESGPSYEYKTDRSLVERIGKKYQWLALSKLLCGLSDKYWIGGELGNKTRRYDNPTDIGFLRDIDPTIVPGVNAAAKAQERPEAWIHGPSISIPPTPEDRLAVWPFRSDPGQSFPELLLRVDTKDVKWATLYDYCGVTTRYEQAKEMQHGIRQQEFRFVFCVIVNQTDKARLVDYVKNKRKIDVDHWKPPEVVDGPFLYEAPWRTTWPRIRWRSDGWATPKDLPVAFPICKYLWESHLDASLPEGEHAFAPSPWLTAELGLSPSPRDLSAYCDSSGTSQFVGCRGRNSSSAVIGVEMFNGYLHRRDLSCIWLLVAARGSWPGGHNENAAWRRTEGICWIEHGKPTFITWNEDRMNAK